MLETYIDCVLVLAPTGWVGAEREHSQGHTARKGQRQGWNHVPGCPVQQLGHREDSLALTSGL